MAEWVTDDAYACRTEESACALPCSQGDLWVAINTRDFRGSATCGACMQVSGPEGQVVVEVIENCAGACAAGEIELSRTAFDAIAQLEEGQADVTWQLVACNRRGPIAFAYEAASDAWWAGIQIRNSRLPIQSLSILLPNEGWTALARDGWNHFPVSASLGSGPFDYRVAAIDGQELLEQGIAYVPGGVVSGQGQFE
jgi:expansin (peptidoglycan-binding protein)